ncbi:MAG TPA: DUF6411 family protein [Solirubrobacter sp.]|nr:DUF6411 family protein [Solirubrobacter sp.]
MLLAAIVALCLIILVLAFLFPRLSRHPQQGTQKAIGAGGRGASHAPGRLGRWFSKPFTTSNKAVSKSGSAGRRGRGKLPF